MLRKWHRLRLYVHTQNYLNGISKGEHRSIFDSTRSFCFFLYLHNRMERIHLEQKNRQMSLQTTNLYLRRETNSLKIRLSFSFSLALFPLFSLFSLFLTRLSRWSPFSSFYFFLSSTHQPSLRTEVVLSRSKNFLFFSFSARPRMNFEQIFALMSRAERCLSVEDEIFSLTREEKQNKTCLSFATMKEQKNFNKPSHVQRDLSFPIADITTSNKHHTRTVCYTLPAGLKETRWTWVVVTDSEMNNNRV